MRWWKNRQLRKSAPQKDQKRFRRGVGAERFEAKFPALAELHTLKGIQEEGVTHYGGSLNLLRAVGKGRGQINAVVSKQASKSRYPVLEHYRQNSQTHRHQQDEQEPRVG